MVTTLILTHGGLARELLLAAETIVGDTSHFRAVTLDWTDSFEEALGKTRDTLAELQPGAQVLILTDMYGGTPYNVAMSLAESGRIEVVTGVNLPMVVRLACPGSNETGVSELARWIQDKARASICLAGEGNGSAARSSRIAAPGPCDD
jgi:PTS system mannose-specific IIA component